MHSTSPVTKAAAHMEAFGRNEVVPSELVIVSALRSTNAPMNGPIIPGINTCPMMRIP